MKNSILAFLFLLSFAPSVAAQETEILYSRTDSTTAMGSGSTKAETYDLAQHISDRALVGMTVKALRITFPFSSGLSEGTAWLSRALPVVKSQRMQTPDIASVEFTPRKGYTEVTFDEPYTVTEEGFYVGYSFKLDASSSARRPVVVGGKPRQSTLEPTPEGLLLHSSQVYRTAWHDLTPDYGEISIQVVLSGANVSPCSAGVGRVAPFEGHTGVSSSTTFELINHGTSGVSSIDYTYEIAGQSDTRHLQLASPLPGIFGRATTISVQLPSVEKKGSYPLVITVTKVNGEPNPDLSARGEGQAILYHTLPVHRAVLEEYTGTWCGYCPRGFVGLEEMHRLHPDDFIGISYHNKDPMEIMPTSQFPSDVSGFPAAFLDRNVSTDAFSGNSASKTFGIEAVWESACSVTAPAEVDIATRWDDDSLLTATAYVTFPVDRDDCPYQLSFLLLADGLHGSGSQWMQSNYYSGETGWPSCMKTFTSGSSYVPGLEFNFVAVATSGKNGIEGSLQAPVEADIPLTYDYSFDLREVVNTSGQSLIQDRERLNVVVLLLDKASGRILNARKVACGKSTLTDGIVSASQKEGQEVVAVRYTDLLGRSVARTNGKPTILLRTETLADGTRRTTKCLF